jgi:TonB family protein
MTEPIAELMFAGLPPSPRRRWRPLAFSFLVQATLLVLALEWIILNPPSIVTEHHFTYMFLTTPAVVNHAPQRRVAKLVTPRLRRLRPIKRAALRTPAPAAPKPDLQLLARLSPPSPSIVAPKPKPAPLPALSTGSSATPTARLDPRRVQTGGFGDPNGLPADNSNHGRPVTIAQAGSFDLPAGPGYGNGSGGRGSVRAVVVSSGFGNGIATPTRAPQNNARAVQSGGFADVQPAAPSTKPRELAKQESLLPVEILFKPKPSYTSEARTLRLEGEVLLEVVFGASGKIQVVRVVRGLGHGLDESAIRAAEQIRYKPATRGGAPIDSSATLHIIFQIA